MKEERPEQQATTSSDGFRESYRVQILALNFQVVPYCHCPNSGIQPQPSTPVAVDLPIVADGWWGVEQAASYLNLTPKAVREGATRGTLQGCVKIAARRLRGQAECVARSVKSNCAAD